MKSHAMFLRERCILPDRFDLRRKRFCEDWELVEDILAADLDSKIRHAGWHFMWSQECRSCRCVGLTEESAINRAVAYALGRLAKRFNAAELDSVEMTKFSGLHIAKVKVQARQIQRLTSLDAVSKIPLLPARAI
jgi:hypothetical protein